VLGLIGPAATLPPHIGEAAVTASRRRSPSLAAFLDMLAQRMIEAFVDAGAKYRPHRNAELAGGGSIGDALLALTGQFTPGIAERLPTGPEPFRHYAGLLAARPRSAERLQALASDFLQRPVQVRQFVGAWLAVPEDERSRLPVGVAPGAFTRLGYDAAAGVRAWDPQARVTLRIGPLDGTSFAAMMPDGGALRRLAALVRAYLGHETGFAVNLVVRRDAIPPLALGQRRLGWNAWLPAGGPVARGDADEPVFDSVAIEEAGALPQAPPGEGPIAPARWEPAAPPDPRP
jgi:type VI secretion system protein ImpH